MPAYETYHEKLDKHNIVRTREILSALPPYCQEFFRGIADRTSTRTRLAYAYDLRVFFEFLHETNPVCNKMEIKDIPISVLDSITRQDIEEYLSYISLYEKEGVEHSNTDRGKARKLSCLKTFYHYFFQNERISKNTAELVPAPKRHEKAIIRLDPNEVAILLDQVEDGTKLTKRNWNTMQKRKCGMWRF